MRVGIKGLVLSFIMILIFTTIPMIKINNFQDTNDSNSDDSVIPNKSDNFENQPIGSRGNEPVIFENVSIEANISQFQGKYFAWADYNNDGYSDLLVNGKKLLRNNGPPGWNFTDITIQANISYSGSINVGVWGDWNNDGYLDFYAAGGGWTTNNPSTYDVLWRNTGPPNYIFEDYTQLAGNVRDSYPSVAAGWGDYDNDGHIDLYVANYENDDLQGWPDTFWHNNGDGTFSDVTISSGVGSIDNRPGRGVAWCDYNNDGWNDIYISNYRITGNFLWENQRNGTFKNVAPEKNCQGLEHYYQGQGPYYGHTIGSSWADYDNDGIMDIMVANLVHKYVGGGDIRGYICDDSNLYHNNGFPNFNFTDNRLAAGIPTKPVGGTGTFIGDELYSGVAWGDFDNDGDLDFWVPQVYGQLNYAYSYLYRNNNDGTFTDIAPSLGVRVWNTYGSAWCDYNNDGFLDLVTGGKSPFVSSTGGSYEIHLYRNNGNTNNWLKVRLIGQESNKAGIGARISSTTGQITRVRQVEGGMGSHAQQNGLVVHFGLGQANSVDELIVQWPNGKAQILNNVAINQQINITEITTGPEITVISASKTEALEDEFIIFDGTAIDPDGVVTKYEWDFDGDNVFDWSSTSSAQVTYLYPYSGEYYAKLRVWDDSGYLFTDKTTPFITINNQPPSAIAGDDIEVWEDDVIIFNASNCTDTLTDMLNLTYNWTFFQGNYSGWLNSTIISFVFTERGNYAVTLTVRDDNNETDIDTILATVKNKPPTCEIISNSVVEEDSTISFSVLSNDTISDSSSLTYKWDFGDGNGTSWTTDTGTEHTYLTKGLYTIRCTVRDDDGVSFERFSEKEITVYNVDPICTVEDNKFALEDQKLYLNGSGSDTQSDLAHLLFLWDFADGTTSEWLNLGDQNTTHTYTDKGIYQVKLIVKDDDDAVCQQIIIITVENVRPRCEAMEDLEINEDDIVSFTGFGIDSKSDMDSLQYSWDLGEPDIPVTPWNSSPEFSYRYTNDGEYVAVLTVRDDDGEIGNADFKIRIKNILPSAKFSASSFNVNEDDKVEFSALQSTDTESDIKTLKYKWNFNDDTPKQTGSITYHKYNEAGEYRIVLSVTDDNDESDTYRKTIKVNNIAPSARITVTSTAAYPTRAILFSGSESSDTISDRLNLSYNWEFGDNSHTTGETVSHEFTEPGRYKVKLTVVDDNNAEAVDEVTIIINEFPEVKSDADTDEKQYQLIIGTGVVSILIIILLIILSFYFIRSKKSQERDISETYPETQDMITEESPIIYQKLPEIDQQYIDKKESIGQLKEDQLKAIETDNKKTIESKQPDLVLESISKPLLPKTTTLDSKVSQESDKNQKSNEGTPINNNIEPHDSEDLDE